MDQTATRPALGRSLANLLLTAGLSGAITLSLAGCGSRLIFADRVLPGVSAAGVDLAGLTRPEVEGILGQTLTFPHTGTVLLLDRGTYWTARPADLGMTVDLSAMATQALAVGRDQGVLGDLSNQLVAWTTGVRLPALARFDQRVATGYLTDLAAQIDRPTIEAGLTLNDLRVVAHPGQIGRRLDLPATLELLEGAFERFHDAEVVLVVDEAPPQVLDVSAQAALAQEILNQPLTLTAEEGERWAFEPAALAAMIRFELAPGGGYLVRLDRSSLLAFLGPLVPELARDPQNARFIFNDDTLQLDLLQAAVIGRELDVEASLDAIQAGVSSGQHEIPLTFHFEPPTVGSEASAADLGITGPVSVVSTYFAGSSPERIRNITTASGAFHGLLIAPGETLSMAEVLGDISLEQGYAEALIIYGDRTIKGVGGGVCQVSTTLFRTALYGGYAIEERHPHAYRVGYYEQGRGSPGPGFDATVFVPLVDFKFTNDTPYWLLSETYVYGTQLLWKFYSTSDGRQVQISPAQVSGIIEAPEPLYKENPDLPEGKIEQVDFEADGMDVLFTRTVTLNGQTLHHDTFKTHYLPWQAIYEYGPGTELPEGVQVEEQA